MSSNESSSLSVSRCGDKRLGIDHLRTVVWVRGEQDIANSVHLSGTIAHASDLDAADIVVDLSGVTFMDASTIGALVDARNHLLAASRSLCVRDPSRRARRVLDLCGLAQLIDERRPAQQTVATALGSWVDVPASDRRVDAAPPVAADAPSPEPARVTARRRVEPPESVQHRQAPS